MQMPTRIFGKTLGQRTYFMHERSKLGYPTEENIKQIAKIPENLSKNSNVIYKLPEFKLRHIFELEISCNGKKLRLSGLHHDYLGNIQKSGVFEVYYKGFDKTCSFFADSWSREKVVEVIHDSLQNLEGLPTVQSNGNLLFKGKTNINGELIEIHTVIDKSNIIRSSYPFIEEVKNDFI